MVKCTSGWKRQNSSSLISWVKIERYNTLPSPHCLNLLCHAFCRNFPLKKKTCRVFYSLPECLKPVTKPGYTSAWSTSSLASPIPTQGRGPWCQPGTSARPWGSAIACVCACHQPACTAVTYHAATWQIHPECACPHLVSLRALAVQQEAWTRHGEAIRVGERKCWVVSWNSTKDTFFFFQSCAGLCWSANILKWQEVSMALTGLQYFLSTLCMGPYWQKWRCCLQWSCHCLAAGIPFLTDSVIHCGLPSFYEAGHGWRIRWKVSGALLLYYRQSVGSYFHSLMCIPVATLSTTLANLCIFMQSS